MSLSQVRNVNFGSSRAGLSGSVCHTILDYTGSVAIPLNFASRSNAGVYELISGSGCYAAFLTFNDNFHGQILWDTGDASVPARSYATEQYNVEENDPKVASIYDIESGRWKVVGNQMIFYKSDNVTEVARFNLYDVNGVPTMDLVAERRAL